ncbi:hypothetical protein CQW23_30860 [Capsicum baccatum]|uniref:A20-type domain-containing protein n=1 Tax=Capsicum baccatum TaxID=33114 RepID=A0A2G2V983_CAPBA|nr:hypothetical protein CQW23_30860 [Capsicum baccatum]
MHSQGGVLLIDAMALSAKGMHGNYKVMSWFSRASSVTGANPPQKNLKCDTCGVELDVLTTEMDSSKEIGCRAPEDPILSINDCGFFGSVAPMNICSKCQKDMILPKQEHANLAAASNKDVVYRSSSSDELEVFLAGSAVASADLASHISQVKSKEGLKKCTACRKHVGLTGFSCKCGDLFWVVHHCSDKHNYRLIIGMLVTMQ